LLSQRRPVKGFSAELMVLIKLVVIEGVIEELWYSTPVVDLLSPGSTVPHWSLKKDPARFFVPLYQSVVLF
jgi:hypothetical protein